MRASTIRMAALSACAVITIVGSAHAAIGDYCNADGSGCGAGEVCNVNGNNNDGVPVCAAPEMETMLIPAFLLAGAGLVRRSRKKALQSKKVTLS